MDGQGRKIHALSFKETQNSHQERLARSKSLTVARFGWFKPEVCTAYTPVRKSEGRFSVLLQSISSPCPALPPKLRPIQSKTHVHLNNVSKLCFTGKQIKTSLDCSENQLQPQTQYVIIIPVLLQCFKSYKNAENNAGNPVLSQTQEEMRTK